MNLQEYKQALKKHLLTFKWLDEKLIHEIVFECNFVKEYLLSVPPQTVVSTGFNWFKTTKGEPYWNKVYFTLSNGQNLSDMALTQPEIQQLLHELRDTLSMVTEIKNEYKIESSRLWELSDKEFYESQGHFEDFCLNRKFYLAYKKREQRLVGLITKLKGLK